MNYITDGTFWFFVVAFAVTIGIVYWILNDKINKIRSFNMTLVTVIDKLAQLVDEELGNIKTDMNSQTAKVYTDMANALKSLSHASNNSKSEAKNAPNKL